MKTKATILVVLALMGGISAKAETVQLSCPNAGELQTVMEQHSNPWSINTAKDLKITGELNGSDIRYLRLWLGSDDDNPLALSADEGIRRLDLSEIRIVAGGRPYYDYATPWESQPADNSHYTCNDELGDFMFAFCESLESIVLPAGVKRIGAYCFVGASRLKEVTVSEGTGSIGQRAFLGCEGLEAVSLPSSLTTIEAYAFEECNSLQTVSVSTLIPPAYGFKCFPRPGECRLLIGKKAEAGQENYEEADGWCRFGKISLNDESTSIESPSPAAAHAGQQVYGLDGRPHRDVVPGVSIQVNQDGRKVVVR